MYLHMQKSEYMHLYGGCFPATIYYEEVVCDSVEYEHAITDMFSLHCWKTGMDGDVANNV